MKNLILCLVMGALLTSCKRNFEDDLPIIDTAKKEVISTLQPTIFAGNESAASVDGIGREAKFYQIIKLSADQAGNVYVLEAAKPGNALHKIRKINANGVTSTVFNGGENIVVNGSIQRNKVYKVLDIAVRADGSVYALASMINNTITYNIDNTTKYYQEYGTYKLSGDSLTRVSVSSTIASLSNTNSWVAIHNLLTNIAMDANGSLYGAYTPAGTGNPAATKVYQITPNPALLNFNTDAIQSSTLTGDAAGALYASTPTDVMKITASGASSIFTFPTAKTSFKPKLVGNLSDNLFVYGDIFDKAKVFKGTGFYTLKSDGTVVNKGILSTVVNPISVAAATNSKLYYAIQLNTGGYLIYKVTLE
jgi:hypothetical protein